MKLWCVVIRNVSIAKFKAQKNSSSKQSLMLPARHIDLININSILAF